jgi:release factor glutamine methyltransferase
LKIIEVITEAAQELAQSGIPNARLDAELLLSHIVKKNRAWFFTHGQDTLDGEQEHLFHALIGRRSRREPLQYILGFQEFWGLGFTVDPRVLIPRPETELLVEAAISFAKNRPRPVVIDLCTGSGCIAVTLAKMLQAQRIFGTDLSSAALDLARENARKHGVEERIRFLEGDLFDPLRELNLREQADIITANPPYIPENDLPSLQPEVKNFEPVTALIAGRKGTEIHERIVGDAPLFLSKKGALFMEIGIGQAETLTAFAASIGAYTRPEILKDLAGIDRIIILKRK